MEEEKVRIEIDVENAKNLRNVQEAMRMGKAQFDMIVTTLINVHNIPKNEKWQLTPDCSAFIKISSPELVKPKGLKDKEESNEKDAD